MKRYFVLLILFSSLFFGKKTEVYAQVCSGAVSSGGLWRCAWNQTINSYTCVQNLTYTEACSEGSFGCRGVMWVPESCNATSTGCAAYNRVDGLVSNGCYYSSPQPTSGPVPTAPPAGWGGCGSCSSCPPYVGSNQCVRAPDGSCRWDPSACGGGGGGPCTVEWQDGPSTMIVGQTARFAAFARGAINWWDGAWRWNTGAPNLGNFNPANHGTGPTFVTNFTASAVGSSIIRFRVHEDNDYNTMYCEATRQLTVLPAPTVPAPPANPTNVVANCNSTGTQITVSWTATPGVSNYAVRADANPVSWNTSLPICSSVNPGDICTPGTILGTSYTFTSTPGENYQVWVQALNAAGTSGGTNPISVTCPVPTGNLRVKTGLASGSSTCSNAASWPNLANVDVTIPSFTPQTKTTTSSVNPVLWNGVASGNHSLSLSPQPGYVLSELCLERSSSPGNINQAFTQTNVSVFSNETTTYYAGFLPNVGWSQVIGGDLLSCNDISQALPETATNRKLNLQGIGGYPGIVIYGENGAFDIDPDVGSSGQTLVSSTNWLVGAAPKRICDMNWYSYFGNQFDMIVPSPSDSPTTLTQSNIGLGSGVVKKIAGDFVTSGAINVANGQSMVLFIDGSLTINGPITRTGTGFIALIVKEGITVSGEVGSEYDDDTPSLQGIYITNGSFNTGKGDDETRERLVIEGTVVAKAINLQRTLETDANNTTTPAEQFVYDPELLFLMPEKMKDVKVFWQEVNP